MYAGVSKIHEFFGASYMLQVIAFARTERKLIFNWEGGYLAMWKPIPARSFLSSLSEITIMASSEGSGIHRHSGTCNICSASPLLGRGRSLDHPSGMSAPSAS